MGDAVNCGGMRGLDRNVRGGLSSLDAQVVMENDLILWLSIC